MGGAGGAARLRTHSDVGMARQGGQRPHVHISLDGEVLNALRAELEGRGVDVKDGHWGYRLMVIVAPDGRIGTRKHFSRDPSAGVSPHRAPPSRPPYQ